MLLAGAEPPEDGYPEKPEPTDVKDVAVHALRNLTREQDVLWMAWDARTTRTIRSTMATTPGRASEVLSCLYLGRPVTVVSRTRGTVLSAAILKQTTGTRIQPRG